MRFQNKKGPPPFLNRKDQFRLLALCVMLFLVLLAFRKAADPATWAWLVVEQPETEIDPNELKDISYLVQDSAQHLKPDEFIGEVLTELPETTPADQPLIELDPELLTPIKDSTIGWYSRAERAAFLKVLEHVQLLGSAQLSQARTDVSYRLINQEPTKIRGELLHIRGILWQVDVFDEESSLYTGWMFTADSGNKPWMVVFSTLPEGLTPGQKLDRPVEVTGYFFKRFGYETVGHNLNISPLLAASTLELPPVVSVEQIKERSNEATYYVVGTLTTALLLLGGLVFWFRLSDRQIAGSRLAELARPNSAATFDPALADAVTTIDPGKLFSTPPAVED